MKLLSSLFFLIALAFAPAALAQSCESISTYGGGPTVANNSPAFQSALAALPATGGCIEFGPGRYTFASTVSYTMPGVGSSLTIKGSGPQSTQLYWPSAQAMSVSANDATETFHLRDLSVMTGAAGTANGIVLTNSTWEGRIKHSDITNVDFTGVDGGAEADYWGNGLVIQNWSGFSFDNDTFYGPSGQGGTGVYIYGTGTGTSQLQFYYDFNSDYFMWENIGLGIGTQTQGVTVNASQFTNGGTCIWTPSGGTNESLLVVTNSQFNCLQHSQISINSPIANMLMSNNIFYIPGNNAGIYIPAYSTENTFTGNTFVCLSNCGGTTGIFVSGSDNTSTVTGNVFGNLSTGVLLDSSTSNWSVNLNRYANVTTPVSNAGSSNNVGAISP